jgi:S-adenosylmethionine-diacylglycerol 3-amino-3-carboxypropyl transferase
MTPTWVTEAAALPLGFAQVREDPAIDLAIVDAAGEDVRVVMVASGGCTAAALAASPRVSWIHLVDPNPAQIALSRLKLRLLETAEPSERLTLLGHAPAESGDRRKSLETSLDALGASPNIFGPPDFVAELGPDHAGRYERLFAQLRCELSLHSDALEALLRLRDPVEQARRVAADTRLGAALEAAFDCVMALPNLVALFGEGATRNPREPFSSHFIRRTRWVLANQPAAGNPFLAQMLLGRFAPGAEHTWLCVASPARLPSVTWAVGPMVEALAASPETFDVVHLSNILDWLSPQAAQATLDLARTALRPGGWVIIRQLNSTLDIPDLGEGFHWRSEVSERLRDGDRSFFYRAIHVGKRP